MAKTNNTVIMIFSIVMFLLLILLLVLTYNSKCKMDNSEKFYELLNDRANSKRSEYVAEYNPVADGTSLATGIKGFAPPMASLTDRAHDGIQGSDPLGNSEFDSPYKNNPNTNLFLETQIAGSCVARDRLTSADLLPLDANSKWAELTPTCGGDLQDQNYLTAAHHIGINTVSQSMRNANLQLRAEEPNPQIPVSSWNISTISPDPNRPGLTDVGRSTHV